MRLFVDSLSCLYVEAHKNLWADHGDFISAQYSGTHALKRDITRTGTRTLGGLLQDGSTALSRYYKSKFSDGSAQDCLNLWASHFLASVDKPSPFAKSGCVFFFLAIATSSLKRLSTGRKRAKRPFLFSAHLTHACYMSLPCSPFCICRRRTFGRRKDYCLNQPLLVDEEEPILFSSPPVAVEY